MDQLRDYADPRLPRGCIYCDVGDAETRDHVPSRTFLDPPYPENLPPVAACWTCNNGFSRDEEYVACLTECAIAGSTDPEMIGRPRVADVLRRAPALRARIEAARTKIGDKVAFVAEDHRVKNVLLKLARGHAAFELSRSLRREPTWFAWRCLSDVPPEERAVFEAPQVTQLVGEVGSRGMQRLLVTQLVLQSTAGGLSTLNMIVNDWIYVQDDRYRYLAADDAGGVTIRIVIREFIACEVSWMDASRASADGS